MVGFGCLAFSHVPGLRRGGVLVSLAVLACLVATVLVLPALESQFSRKT
jgi:predicted RND superfamily exporter protein